MTRTTSITDLSLKRLARRESAKWSFYPDDVLPAWVAEMDFPLAPAIKRVLIEAIELDDCGYANSPPATGIGEAFAGFAERRLGWSADPAQVAPVLDVVAGISELLRVLTRPGDGVIINPPVYPPFFSVITDADRRLVEVPLADGYRLDLEGIERAFADGARVLALCHPHNPTGTVPTVAELEAIATAAAAHEAWVISDEIHAPLVLPGAEHASFATVSDAARERGIVLTSASKAFNIAGLKCALAVTASETARREVARFPESAGHCGHLGALATVAAFADSDQWLDEVISVLDHNRAMLGELLAERLPEIGYQVPAAGYLAWLEASALGMGADPEPVLLERGRVALMGGPRFGQGGDGFVRLNFATSPELLEEIVDRVATAVGR